MRVNPGSGDRKSSSPPIQYDHVDDDNIDKSNPGDGKVVITPRYMMMISMKIILIREQPQVMGKPANALLIDCRSMEGKLVSSSSKFMHDLLKAVWLSSKISFNRFDNNHNSTDLIIIINWSSSDWCHYLIPELRCWSQTQMSNINWLAVSCLRHDNRFISHNETERSSFKENDHVWSCFAWF